MNQNNDQFNREAASLQPDDLPWPATLGNFWLPDFRDAVMAAPETAPEPAAESTGAIAVEALAPAAGSGDRTLYPVVLAPEAPVASSDQGCDVARVDGLFDGLLEEPDLLLPAPGKLMAGPGDRIRLELAIAGWDLDCEPLLRRIGQLKESPAGGVLLFCDVDDGARAGIAAGIVARQLAASEGNEVLLIDSGLEGGELSELVGADELAGTREFLRAMSAWQAVACPTDIPHLSMIPCGKQKLRFSEPSSFVDGVCRKALGQMLERFSHVLVTSGTAFDNSLFAWRGFCSATLLTLDAASSSRSIAQAAVRELNASGCRVMGCLATPVRATVKPLAPAGGTRAA
jgi:hypothetical protein